MATKKELLEKTKEELLEDARKRDIEGRSGMSKDELAKALADGSSDSEAEKKAKEAGEPGSLRSKIGTIAVDEERAEELEDRAVEPDESEELADERLETVEEEAGEETAKLTAHDELDVHGPLKTQPPHERIMTGAVSEEHAKEQEEALKNKPEDYVGDVSEAGFDDEGRAVTSARLRAEEEGRVLEDDRPSVSDPDRTKGELRAEGELKQEDVIDYDSERKVEEPRREPSSTEGRGPLSNTTVIGASDRVFAQKAVMYTDGLSGAAESNLERAYEVPELLQSNNPVVREAGDQSLSEAAKEDKSEDEREEAEDVKSGDREEREEETRDDS